MSMRLLIDSSAWGGMQAGLVSAGHEVVSVADIWQDDPGDDHPDVEAGDREDVEQA